MSNEFLERVEMFLRRLEQWNELVTEELFDTAIQQMVARARKLWSLLVVSQPSSKPIFLFKDGPVTRAARLGLPILLEVRLTFVMRQGGC